MTSLRQRMIEDMQIRRRPKFFWCSGDYSVPLADRACNALSVL
jgi:hypothetical protein